MRRRSKTIATRVANSVVAILCALGVAAAHADPASVPAPTIVKLPDAVVAQFKANPSALLTTYASGGLPLLAEARSLALTDPSVVDLLIDVARKGNDAQKGAIGAALAQAARILATSEPELAKKIQQAVAQSGLGPLITAFLALSNGLITTSLGEGGGAAGSGGPVGGVGAFGGASSGASVSSGQTNGVSAFGALGAGPSAPSGGLTSGNHGTSPFKTSL